MKLKAAVVIPAALVGILLVWPLVKVIVGEPELPALIPLPQKIAQHRGSFTIRASTRIVADSACKDTAEMLAIRLRKATSFQLNLEAVGAGTNDAIVLTLQGTNPALGPE